jgi:hypothetical protein
MQEFDGDEGDAGLMMPLLVSFIEGVDDVSEDDDDGQMAQQKKETPLERRRRIATKKLTTLLNQISCLDYLSAVLEAALESEIGEKVSASRSNV